MEIGLGLGLYTPGPHPNQVVKTLVLARITPKSFRLLPGVSQQEAAAVLKDPSLTGSNVYSPSEALVLRWLELHWRREEVSVTRPHQQPDRLTSFEQLRDGRVFDPNPNLDPNPHPNPDSNPHANPDSKPQTLARPQP